MSGKELNEWAISHNRKVNIIRKPKFGGKALINIGQKYSLIGDVNE